MRDPRSFRPQRDETADHAVGDSQHTVELGGELGIAGELDQGSSDRSSIGGGSGVGEGQEGDSQHRQLLESVHCRQVKKWGVS